LSAKKEDLLEEKKEEFRKTMILEQTIEEVEQVDGQNWRANSEDDYSGDEESE
jgi:hypothetical protein